MDKICNVNPGIKGLDATVQLIFLGEGVIFLRPHFLRYSITFICFAVLALYLISKQAVSLG